MQARLKIGVLVLVTVMIAADSLRPLAYAQQDSGTDIDLPTGDTPIGDMPGLKDLRIKDVPFLSDLTIAQTPGLKNLRASLVPQLYYLVSSSVRNTPLGEIPGLKDLVLKTVPVLADLQIQNVPGLRDVPAKDIPGLANLTFQEVPGLKDEPWLSGIPQLQKVKIADVNDVLAMSGLSFGGVLTKKKLLWCVISHWPPILIPFQYVEAELETLGPTITFKLYRIFFFSLLKMRRRLEKTSLVLGSFLPGADEAFLYLCRNREKIKNNYNAQGLIFQIGTGCKDGEEPGDRKCPKSSYEKNP